MDSHYLTIKHHLINLDNLTHIELRKKFVDFYFGDFKLSISMKNTKNSEKQFQRIGEILKTYVFDFSIKPKKSKKISEGEKTE